MPPSRPAHLSAKPRLMILSKVWNAIVRATAALLLMAAFATPALAEIGCAGDSVVHLAGASSSDEVSIAPAPDGSSGEERSGQPDHCGFGHGHCAGIAAGAARGAELLLTPSAYAPLASRPIGASSLETPERPPNA